MLDLRTTTHNENWSIYEQSMLNLPLPEFDRLCSQSVPITAFAELPGPGQMKVTRSGGRSIIDKNGRNELIFPCWRDGRLTGIVSWNGASLAALEGREAVLGFDVLIDWSDHLRPLRIFQSPVDWLAAEGVGIVIIDPVAAWRILERFNHFLADDLAHGERLERILQRPMRRLDIQIPSKEMTNA